MNQRNRIIIRIVLGGYLVYLGVRILMQVIQNEPSNSEVMGALAVLFIFIGCGYAGFSLRGVIKSRRREKTPEDSGPDETQEDEGI